MSIQDMNIRPVPMEIEDLSEIKEMREIIDLVDYEDVSGVSLETEEKDEVYNIIHKRGMSGLNNLGNTCYMNAGLQCIMANPKLVSYFRKKQFKENLIENIIKTYPDQNNILIKDLNKSISNTVTYQLYKIIKEMWKINQTINPVTLKKLIGSKNAMFAGFMQNDSQEFLNFTLDVIHEELKTSIENYKAVSENAEYVEYNMLYKTLAQDYNQVNNAEIKKEILKQIDELNNTYKTGVLFKNALRFEKDHMKKEYSIIKTLFNGTFYTRITCTECNEVSNKFDPFNLLSLPIPELVDDAGNFRSELMIEDCFSHYTLEENLDDSNKYRCDKCKNLVNAKKQHYVIKAPQYLIIQLKRFQVRNNRLTKNNTVIKFPIENLDIKEIMYDKEMCVKYNLYAVTQHMGGVNGGHYIASTKNIVTGNWYEFDDDDVTCIQDKYLDKLVNNNAYILFYERV